MYMPNLVYIIGNELSMKKRIIPLEIFFSSIIIITIIIFIIILCLEINAYSKRINKKTEATVIASNIIENIKTKSYIDIENYINELSYMGISKKIENDIQYVTIYGDSFTEKFFGTQIPKDYEVEFEIENYSEEFDIQKKISITLTYKINNTYEKFNISTVVESEDINECNEPIISDEYFKELDFLEKEYEIIPIKYSKLEKKYVTTNKNDFEWYNYSAKIWAKVIVFSKEDNLKDLFIEEDGTVKNQVKYDNTILDIKNYIYVWIPNFSIKDDITYFRYKASKKAIKMDVSYVEGKYLYSNKISEDIKDISEDCNFDGIYGVWRKLGDEADLYYSNFNKTKYAPIKLD